MSYVDKAYYTDIFKGNEIDDSNIDKSLRKASRHIDTLTFNRIKSLGFEKLTDFQKDIIKEVTCELAEFEYENAELIENVLSSYSINGVSMNFGGSWNVQLIKGVAIPTELHETLKQTGLCSLSFRRF